MTSAAKTATKALLEAAMRVLTGESIEIARHLRALAERTIRPKK